MYLLYSTDVYITKDSYCLLQVCDSKDIAIKFAKKDSISVKDELSENDLNNLLLISQTRGRKENYIIENTEMNYKSN